MWIKYDPFLLKIIRNEHTVSYKITVNELRVKRKWEKVLKERQRCENTIFVHYSAI